MAVHLERPFDGDGDRRGVQSLDHSGRGRRLYAYVPSKLEMAALPPERAQLEASIEDLAKHGARLKHSMCGKEGETCADSRHEAATV